MAKTNEACPVCIKGYNLEERLPKSLECCHSICQACLMGNGEPLTHCLLCKQRIANSNETANDWTVIDYLEKNVGMGLENENTSTRETLLKHRRLAEQEERKIYKLLTQLTCTDPEEVKKEVALFDSTTRRLIKERLSQRMHDPNGIKSKAEEDLNHRLEVIHRVVSNIDSLLVKESVTKEEFQKCHLEALKSSLKTKPLPDSADGILWDAHSEMVLGHLICRETSKDIADKAESVRKGKKFSLHMAVCKCTRSSTRSGTQCSTDKKL